MLGDRALRDIGIGAGSLEHAVRHARPKHPIEAVGQGRKVQALAGRRTETELLQLGIPERPNQNR